MTPSSRTPGERWRCPTRPCEQPAVNTLQLRAQSLCWPCPARLGRAITQCCRGRKRAPCAALQAPCAAHHRGLCAQLLPIPRPGPPQGAQGPARPLPAPCAPAAGPSRPATPSNTRWRWETCPVAPPQALQDFLRWWDVLVFVEGAIYQIDEENEGMAKRGTLSAGPPSPAGMGLVGGGCSGGQIRWATHAEFCTLQQCLAAAFSHHPSVLLRCRGGAICGAAAQGAADSRSAGRAGPGEFMAVTLMHMVSRHSPWCLLSATQAVPGDQCRDLLTGPASGGSAPRCCRSHACRLAATPLPGSPWRSCTPPPWARASTTG